MPKGRFGSKAVIGMAASRCGRKEQRAIYWRDEDRYPSNLTDAEWERLKPLMILREQLGREASPTAAVIGSQTLKAAEKGAVLTAR